MKRMIILLALFAASVTGSAQVKTSPPPPPGEKGKPHMSPEEAAQKQADNLEKVLTLGTEQKNVVKNAALTRINKVRAIRKKYGKDGDKKAMHSEVKAVRKAFVDEVNAKLTADQQVKWKSYRQQKRREMKASHDAKKDKNAPPPPPEDDNDDGSED
ncbi:MAG: hypothetical protein ACJ76F_09695 [Bacteroidia bacterium]